MKTIYLLLVLFVFTISAFERKSKSSTKETTEEEASLISEIITWRQNYNLNRGDNLLDRIEDLDVSSHTESEYLIENADKFGVQDNFYSEVKSQNLGDDQYFTEIIAKIQDANKADLITQIITLWTSDKEITEHLKYEYNQVGCSCKIYGNGRICVMHLRLY